MTERAETEQHNSSHPTTQADKTSSFTDMALDKARSQQLVSALSSVSKRVASASPRSKIPRLVLVSKLHPTLDINYLHSEAHKQLNLPEPFSHFGENYLAELQYKASKLPKTINWHFIGGLQSNKAKPLASSIPNLWCVSSVDSVKKANELEKGRTALEEQEGVSKSGRVRIHIQVNTSGEKSKSGVEPSEAVILGRHIRQSCPHLVLIGLMTIGAIGRSSPATEGNTSENEDYVTLKRTREQVTKELGMPTEELELSMGMSGDFEEAIRQGSDEVRVGSTIFGSRPATGSMSIEDIENRGKEKDEG